MTCPCGKPLGHTGRHRTYQTPAEQAAARWRVKQAAMQRLRERRRALGLCQHCKAPSERYTRCLACRARDAAQRSQRRRREAA